MVEMLAAKVRYDVTEPINPQNRSYKLVTLRPGLWKRLPDVLQDAWADGFNWHTASKICGHRSKDVASMKSVTDRVIKKALICDSIDRRRRFRLQDEGQHA